MKKTLGVLLTVLVTFLMTEGAARAQSVALTFDDGPSLQETPKLSPAARNAAILAALKAHDIRAALFVTLDRGADRAEGLELARAWGEAGHFIGNHTVTHPDLNGEKVSLQEYQNEILRCDSVIQKLLGYQLWFRFTYLREGNTPEKRDGIQVFLKSRGIRNAYVSLDTSDWRLNQALIDTLKARPDADPEPFRVAYLSHLRQRAEAYRDLSRRLFGRDIAQVMLLHHNLINALFLNDAIQLFKNMGWKITDPETAYQDFVYSLLPQRPAPGQSLLLSCARSLGYRPNDLERLCDDGDADIESLERQGVLPKNH